VTYSVEFRPSALKSLKRLPKQEVIKIKSKIDKLAEQLPNPNITKLKSNNSFHRVRSGSYRIVYEINNDKLVILVVKVGHRKDVYKRL
jgi:mRNA interferase RelE/StbE